MNHAERQCRQVRAMVRQAIKELETIDEVVTQLLQTVRNLSSENTYLKYERHDDC